MKHIDIGKTGFVGPSVAVGFMRLGGLSLRDGAAFINGAVELGANYFDHADIYGTEEHFGRYFAESGLKREDVLIQTKCGIRRGLYDFSKEHIIASAEASLKKLGVEYLDALLLHRPDTLMEPEEVAEAFNALYNSGKVRSFGVSNHNGGQIALLESAMDRRLIINQLQFSPTNSSMIDSGVSVNMLWDQSVNRDGGVLEYCRLNNITIQAWSPFQYGFFEGTYLESPKFKELNVVFHKLGIEYGVTPTTIASAWILRHPAKMQLIAGTTKLDRLKEIAAAADITLTREQWYDIYRAAGHKLP